MKFPNPMIANLALTLMVGGADVVAREQGKHAELSAAIMPLIAEYGDPSTSRARLIQLIRYMQDELDHVLGEGWKLPEDFRRQIEALSR